MLGWAWSVLLRAACVRSSMFFDTSSFSQVFLFFRKYWKSLGNGENGSAESLGILVLKKSCLQLCASYSASRMKAAGSSWLGNLGAGEEGNSAVWENDVVFSVGGSPSLNQSSASGELGDRERQGERKKEGAKIFSQCHLVGQVQIHGPEHWCLGKKRAVPSGVELSAWVVSWAGSALLAAFAGSLCLGSPAAALFTFGASRERVKHSWGTFCFLKGWG